MAEAAADYENMIEHARRTRGTLGAVVATLLGFADLVRRIPMEHFNEWRANRRFVPGPNGPTEPVRPGAMETTMTMWKEVRQAARTLLRRPGFSAIATTTLALGIGATVTIFTVVNAVLIQPLPYADSERLVVVSHHAPGLDLPELNNSPGTVNLYREHARSFAQFGVFGTGSLNLLVDDRADRVELAFVTPNMFDVLQVGPLLGRRFNEADGAEDAPKTIILSHAAFRGRFGGDPNVLGRSVQLDGDAFEVVGVMPEGFAFPTPEVIGLVPMYVDPNGAFGEFGMNSLARLAPGVSLAAAEQEAVDLQNLIPELIPDIEQVFLDQVGWSASVSRYRDRMVGDVESVLWIVLGTVGFLLLIACANVANLFLVRAESRQKELAIRAAMGAGRGRLASGYLSESLLLALAGGGLGLLLAAFGVNALVAAGPAELPRLHEVGIDGTIIAFSAAISLLAGLSFGAIPIARYLGKSFARVLRDGGRGTTVGKERHRMRNVLVTLQLAMALVLLVGSGLMLRTFAELRAVDPGIEAEGLMTVDLSVGDAQDNAARARFYQEVIERVAALPGVEGASATTSLPVLPTSTNGGSFYVESRPRTDEELPPVAMYDAVAPDYFRVMGISVLEGRGIERADHEEGRPVVWVSRAFVQAHLPDGALGERIRFDEAEPWLEVVGVVGDVRNFGLKEDVRPVAYLPMHIQDMARQELGHMAVVARTDGDPAALTPSIRRVVNEVDGRVPITDSRTMSEVVAASMADTSFTMVLLGIAAGVALLLGAVGIYGVIAYVVSQRTREIGVRMALGARSEDVKGMVVRQGLKVTTVGVILGLLGAFGLTRVMSSVLFGVSATDPATFELVPLTLVAVSVLASYIPARRASHIDPNEALRAE